MLGKMICFWQARESSISRTMSKWDEQAAHRGRAMMGNLEPGW